jgi:hypothetical protein
MKFNFVCKNLTISKDMQKDDLIKDLYDLSLQKNLYFRDILLDPEKSVRYYFPVDMDNVCIYNHNTFRNKLEEKKELEKTIDKNIIIICGYLLFIYGITLLC